MRLWRDHENCGGDESRFARLNRRCPPPPQGFALSGASISVSPLRVPSPAAGTKRRVAATRRLTKFQGRVKVLNSGIYFFFRNNNRFSWHCNLSDGLGFFIKSKPFRCFGYTIHATKKCIGLGFFNRIISSNILGDGNRRVKSESGGGIRAPIA